MTATKATIAAIAGGIIAIGVGVIVLLPLQTDTHDVITLCEDTASCIAGTITRIVDGDTLDVENIRIRLALVDTPEVNEPGYDESKQFTGALCPVGSNAIVDVDDGQPKDSFGRTVAKVSCGDKILNAELLKAKLATILPEFCAASEFAGEDWARGNGC